MNPSELRQAVIELLYDLHTLNKLSLTVVNCISREFQIDAIEICEEQGITYNLE